jgi:hypothetical protein
MTLRFGLGGVLRVGGVVESLKKSDGRPEPCYDFSVQSRIGRIAR